MKEQKQQPVQEQFEVPPKQQEEQQNTDNKLTAAQQLAQQNAVLKNVIQGLISALDKVSRSQSQVLAQIGTISNSLESILQSMSKPEEQLK